eukprot:5819397-Pyramimonas_sp.AAC.1
MATQGCYNDLLPDTAKHALSAAYEVARHAHQQQAPALKVLSRGEQAQGRREEKTERMEEHVKSYLEQIEDLESKEQELADVTLEEKAALELH